MDLPIENGGSFHGYVSHNQMVSSPTWLLFGLSAQLLLVKSSFPVDKSIIEPTQLGTPSAATAQSKMDSKTLTDPRSKPFTWRESMRVIYQWPFQEPIYWRYLPYIRPM